MNKQKTVDSKVLAILRECPETRYDDMQLILCYYNRYSYMRVGDLPLEDIVNNYATLMKLEGKDWRQFNLVSLAGVYSPKQKIEDSKVPVTLGRLLEKDKTIRRIVLHLDNDIAGRKATKALQTILSDKYEVVDDPPQYGKDVNDFLCKRLGIKDKTERSFAR